MISIGNPSYKKTKQLLTIFPKLKVEQIFIDTVLSSNEKTNN